ncbi:MAG TPA: PAS domain-containing protein [Chroococcidiopsis sp.]
MSSSQKIEAVYQRAALLRQYAIASSPEPNQLEDALQALSFVLEELQTSEDELRQQNQLLLATRAQVEAEKKRYQELFHLAPDGYLVTDGRGVIQEANAAIARMLKVSANYLIGKPMSIFMTEADRPAFYNALMSANRASVSEQLISRTWEIQMLSPQDSPLAISVTLSVTNDGVSGGLRLLWMLHDITPQQHRTQLLENLNTELEHQAQEQILTSIQAQEQAEAAQQSKSELLATISYELRTALHTILGLSELLQSETVGKLNMPQKRAIATVQNSGNYLLKLLNSIK